MPGMQKDAADLSSDRVQKKSDYELRRIILKGKQGTPEMPGHPWLSSTEVDYLIKYIRTLKSKAP